MNAVIYARVSSREQEQEGYSIPAQLKLLREYASKQGFSVITEYVDVETAKESGRKAFGEMVQFLRKNGNSRVVLVEKTDRLYRNFRDAVTLEDVNAEIHLVKDGQIISENAKSQAKLIHHIQLVLARNYVENLREEVKKGMREKAEQGFYPGRAPFGYRNNSVNRSIGIHEKNSEVVRWLYTEYETGQYSLLTLGKKLREVHGVKITRSYLHTILTNPFYMGLFVWGGKTYSGKHPGIISPEKFESVQQIFRGFNRPKYRKHGIAFRGLLACAYDNCTVTGELKKGKYVYYRCSGYRGKCELPRFREEQVSEKLGELLKDIYVPEPVVSRIVESMERDRQTGHARTAAERAKLEQRLTTVRRRMDQAYADKLDGKITEELWERNQTEWRAEEQRIQMALNGLSEANNGNRVLDAKRILELANKAYFLYLTQKPAEQRKLLEMVLLNCSIDAVSVYPTYRKPFDVIFQRAKNEEWSGRQDLNL